MRPQRELRHSRPRSPKPDRYRDCLPAISLVWETLDYCCAERLHPVRGSVAEQLAGAGLIYLDAAIRRSLSSISRATLARRLRLLPTPEPRLVSRPGPASRVISRVPVERYCWDESRPGALEVDLLEHNGSTTSGIYACPLCVTDIVTG